MIKYPKIKTLLNRDGNTHKVIDGQWRTPEFRYLANNTWVFTEKIDGTNIRVMWDGNTVQFAGRTDRAHIPPFLLAYLAEVFVPDKFSGLFDSPVCLYGEGFGARIQRIGHNYIPDGVGFALFDARIENWWLKREDIEEIAKEMECAVVPVIGKGTLIDAINITKSGFESAWGGFLAEGLVVRPAIQLFNRRGDRIIGKIKYKDFAR